MMNYSLMEKLSDFQLYSLTLNTHLRQDIKVKTLTEFDRREFSKENIDQLAIAYQNIIPPSKGGLSIWEKAGIIASSFLIPVHAIIANFILSRGNFKKWEQYWRCITWGLLIWTVIVLLIAKLFLKY